MRMLAAVGLAAACTTGAAAQEAQPAASDDGFWSRITIAAPAFTRHYPHDSEFNDNNWGGFAFYAFTDQLYFAGGDFINSYKKNTAFVAVAYLPLNLSFSRLNIDAGGMLGVDLNGGYKGYNSLDPALGALIIKFSGNYFDAPDYQFLNRAGLLLTIIPGVTSGTSTAFNLALTYRL
jgi:opacity protein-like surface antigen